MAERPTPMAHATLIMVVSAGRVPVAIATPGRARLDWRWRPWAPATAHAWS